MKTCLSPEVAALYDSAFKDNYCPDCCDGDGLLRLDWVSDWFGSPENLPDALTLEDNVPDAKWMERTIHLLGQQGALKTIAFNFVNVLSKNKDKRGTYLAWTGANYQYLMDVIPSFVKEDVGAKYEAALVVTASLNRALGDIHYWQKPLVPVPFLLRDIIASDALSKVLGLPLVRFLQVFLGSCKSLNVRNLLWHGYFINQDIPSLCCLCLLSISVCIGKDVLKGESFEHRAVIGSLPNFVELHADAQFASASSASVSVLKNLVEEVQEGRQLWLYGISLVEDGKWSRAVVVLLPLVEIAMRRLFIRVHNGDESMLRAKLDEKYISMDQMVTEQVSIWKRNGCLQKLCSRKDNVEESANLLMLGEFNLGEANLLLDVYERLSGPRVRDILSHFDCAAVNVVDEPVCKLVLMTAAVILNHWHVGLTSSEGGVGAIQDFVGAYEPLYYPKHRLKMMIEANLKAVADLEAYMAAEEDLCADGAQKEVQGVVPDCFPADLADAAARLSVCHGISLGQNLFAECPGLAVILHNTRLQCLYRPKKELELVCVLSNVVRADSQMLANLRETLEEKVTLKRNRQLRSRQRKTFDQMLDSLATLLAGSRLICAFAALCILSFEMTDDVPVEKCLRRARLCLKVAENNATNVLKDKNRWLEASTLVTDELFRKLPSA